MLEFVLIGGAIALAGLVIGALLGAWFADKKLRIHYREVRGEIARLRAVAEEKLGGDDPKLDDLLENLHAAANKAYAAIQAMENQAAITKRKSDGSKEVIASSRYVMRMIDEYSGNAAEPYEISVKKPAPAIATENPFREDPHAEEAPVQKALARKRLAEGGKA